MVASKLIHDKITAELMVPIGAHLVAKDLPDCLRLPHGGVRGGPREVVGPRGGRVHVVRIDVLHRMTEKLYILSV